MISLARTASSHAVLPWTMEVTSRARALCASRAPGFARCVASRASISSAGRSVNFLR